MVHSRRLLALVMPLLAALGCSSTTPAPDEAGVTTNVGGTSSMSEGETGAMDETTDTGDGDTDTDTGIRLDVMVLPDVFVPACWMSYLTEMEANAQPGCMFGPFDPNLYVEYIEVCVDAPLDGTCSDICPPDQLCEGMEGCYWASWFQLCGPYEIDDACCLLLATPGPVTTD